jgi:hypothetical protein
VKVAGLLCALVLAPALVACGSQSATAGGFISDTVSHQIPALSHVASALAGKHATVNCWSNKAWAQLQAWDGSHHYTRLVDAAGITYPKNRRIELAPVVCEILAQVLNRSAQQPLYTAWAVNVLAHESAHASGIEVENRAECRAIATHGPPSSSASRRLLADGCSTSSEARSIPTTFPGTDYRPVKRAGPE